MQALCKQEAAASLNRWLDKQPQPLERGEVAEGLKQEGALQHLVAGLQDDCCLRHQGGDWLPLVLCKVGPWASTGIIILLSCLCSLTCLSPKSQVAAALEEDSQLKTTLTQMTFPLGEKRV